VFYRLLTCVGFLILSAAPARASVVIDQSTLLTPTTGIGFASYVVSANNLRSMALMPSKAGRLRQIDLQVLQLDGTSDLTVAIARGGAGNPGFQTHGTFTVARSSVPTDEQSFDGSLVSVDVSSLAFDVSPMQVFSIVLGSTAAEAPNEGFGWVYGERAADDSEFNFMDLEMGFSQVSNDGGMLWTVTPRDVGFRISIDTNPPSVGAVPEPATWAMIIAGFGIAGASMRRRRMAVG
jgi:hypothetical protein